MRTSLFIKTFMIAVLSFFPFFATADIHVEEKVPGIHFYKTSGCDFEKLVEFLSLRIADISSTLPDVSHLGVMEGPRYGVVWLGGERAYVDYYLIDITDCQVKEVIITKFRFNNTESATFYKMIIGSAGFFSISQVSPDGSKSKRISVRAILFTARDKEQRTIEKIFETGKIKRLKGRLFIEALSNNIDDHWPFTSPDSISSVELRIEPEILE